MTQDAKEAVPRTLFVGGGEMGALMRSHDWSQTSLGAVEHWSQSLKTAVRIMLTSRQPMFVWWGEDLINLYNDAYRAILGGKHPVALGQPASEVWCEIWDQVGPRAESAMLNNEGTYDEALLLIMERNGYPEETYYTFSYSPVPNDQGHTGGIICANTDDTQRIVGERQLALLRELAARTADARTFDDACTFSANCLGSNPYDLPFAMIYLVAPDHQHAVLAGTSGIERGHALAPETIACDDDSVWPFAAVLQSHQACVISDIEKWVQNQPMGVWPRSPQQAVAVPIAPSGQTGKAGILVAGLNPFRLFDDNYQGFIDLIAAQISASIANAQAYEDERKRAEALAELDRAKTAFFSNVSHEFRTPLTLIMSPLEELGNTLDDRLQPDEREQLKLLQRNGLRLQKLVNSLLDFSRIEAGRVQVSYEPIDLALYTAELASVFRSLIEQAGMDLVIDCPPLPQPVYVDCEMWEKIVFNLISNAFKFTFAGCITVRLHPVGHTVELSITDTGVGIPEAELPRLFERFHRVSGTRARTYEGSGIGLALVQELVNLQGGTIQVTSYLDHGTTFTIALPFGSAHLPSDRIQAPRLLTSTAMGAAPYVEEIRRWLPEDENGTVDGWRGEPLSTHPPLPCSAETYGDRPTEPLSHRSPATPLPKILLADDNSDMRHYVKRLLHQQYDVLAVTNGVEALEKVHQQLPDLVLTDVMMPELDGFELLRQLRANPQTHELPIILLSARAGEESRIEGLEAGADDYLIKPFSARELLARVETNLKLARLRQEASQQERNLRSAAEAAYNQLHQILESMTDAFVALDRDWRIIYQNAAAEQINGKSRAEVLGKTHWEEWPASVGSNVEHQYRRAMAEQVPVHLEHRYYIPPSYDLWLEIHAYPSETGLGIFFRNISDRKRSEQALQESNDRFSLALQATKTIYWERDLSSDQLLLSGNFANPATPQSMSYQEALTWIHPEDHPHVQQAHATTIAVQRSFEVEYRLRESHHADWRWVLSRGTVLTDAAGQPTRMVGVSIDVTEHKQAEAALRESEEQLRLASEGANLGLWYWNAETETLSWTDRAKAMFGLPMDTEMSMPMFLEAVHPEDRPFVQAIISDFQVGQTHTEGEYRTLWADGTIRWILARGNYSYNADGTLASTRGVLMDITDRRQAQEAMRQSEEKYRRIVETASEGIWIMNADTQTTYVNQQMAQMLGYAPEEMVGHSCFEFIHGPDWAEAEQNLKQRRLGIGGQSEFCVRRKDGSPVWILSSTSPMMGEQGEFLGALAMVTDITNRKRANERLHLLYETTRDLLATEHPMRLMNNLFDKLADQLELHYYYNYMVEEKDNQPMLHLRNYGGISDEVAQSIEWIEFSQHLCGLVAHERRQISLDRIQISTHPNAKLISAIGITAYAGQPLIVKGRLLGTLSFCSRTRTYFTPEELDLLQSTCEQMAIAIERANLTASIQQQAEQLQQANRIKDEFLAVLSHELRSPLNPIVGWSKLLRSQKLDAARTNHALEIIERNAQMQAQLINDLLDVSRILQGKISLNVSPVDLASTIQAALETVRLAAEAKSIQLHTQFEPHVGSVSGDSGRLQQVVWNLLSNAVKFTPEGGRVAIRLERLGSHAQLTVQDTGKGIPANFLPHVFEYFRQSDATTTRKFGGLGLGLAIVRYLVELHGGTVQADSPGEGHGSTFSVKLPLMPHPPATLPGRDASKLPLDLNGMRILVVDDDDNTREFITFLLELHGANVLAAASAGKAIALFSQFKPTMLLSDIGMPDVDGYMLMRQVRALPPEQGGDIPAICLTAYAGEINYQQAIAAGFQKHLPKPVEPDLLVETIASLAQQSG